jgi:flotillin
LTPLQIDINLTDALSAENIRVRVPSQVTVAIGDTEQYQQNAASRLLNLAPKSIIDLAQNIIFGQMRQVIAQMKIEEINVDRDTFRGNIEHAIEPELMKIGLKLINVNIKDLNDESGYIEAIGQKAGAGAVNRARGDVAEEERMGETRVAQANQQKFIAVANAEREREIGVKSAERDTAVRVAELDRETSVAQQRAGFLRDTEIAQADQERRIAVAAANAEAVAGETQAKALVAEANATLHVREADAYQKGETRKRIAEAAVQEEENRAQAKAALADAERIEAERRAELEAPAKAEKAKRIVEAEARAESTRLEAKGQADATFARLEAEARGEFEQLSKKAEGLKKIVEAAGSADDAYRLLMLEHIDYLADTAAKAISNIKFDKVIVWENGGQNGRSNTADFLHKMAGTLPPMMQVMRDIGGIEIPESLAKLVDEDGTHAGSGAKVAGNGRAAKSEPPKDNEAAEESKPMGPRSVGGGAKPQA